MALYRTVFFRTALAWLGLFFLAFVNGALRELGFKLLGGMQEPLAHQLSCLTGVVIWTSFVLFVWKKIGILSYQEAAWVGFMPVAIFYLKSKWWAVEAAR